MLRFRLWRIPVEVHPSHLAVSAVLALTFLPKGAGEGWPERILSKEGSPGYLQTVLLYVAGWVAIVFVSALVHEMGHALAARWLGYSPRVQLIWLGGLTYPNATGPIPWKKQVLFTAAGPAAGLALGALALAGHLAIRQYAEIPGYLLGVLFFANLIWAVYNLLPVLPLDGGQISLAVLQRAFGKPGFLIAQFVGLAASIAVILLAVALKAIVLAAFMGMSTLTVMRLIAAYFRGEAPAPVQAHPSELAFVQAAALFRGGKLDEAAKLAGAVLDSDIPPASRGRLHHLLGWIALKTGSGREALDHFSQVQGQPVESQALAAAFSLIGDEARALPLWEQAFRQTRDPTVLHEWAGALLRSGKLEDAKGLPGVDLPTAYGCAERVAFLRGDFAAAARLGEAALSHSPRAEVAYDAACAHARASDTTSALRLLEKAQELGFKDADYAAADPDLEALKEDPRFKDWLGRVREPRSPPGVGPWLS
ncbi:MAG: TPR end-of-group domain-containing protein [Myxococcaceae bacterium]